MVFNALRITVVPLLCIGAWAGEKPRALMAMEHAREAIRTGHLIWSMRCNLPPQDDGILNRWHSWDVPRYFESRFTPNEYLVNDHGDPRGIVRPQADGAPHPDIGYDVQSYMYFDNEQWEFRQNDVCAEVFEKRHDLIDVRTFGLSGSIAYGQTANSLFPRPRAAETYDVREVNGLYEVTVRDTSSGRSVEYAIDPERGWNPVRVSVRSGSELLGETRTELEQYGDVWFPKQIKVYDPEFKGGLKPAYIMTVQSATFNEPDHPRQLTPESIGIDVGTLLEVFTEGFPRKRQSTTAYWDGHKVISETEYETRLRSGEPLVGDRTQTAINRSLAMGYELEQAETEMESYVRRFIARYQLNEDQAETAWRVLRDCQDRAHQHLERHKKEIEETRAAVRRLTDPTDAKTVDSAAELRNLGERMARLRAPTDEIFFGQLVPRLEKLPTRAQRAAAARRDEEANTKKPAAATP